MTSKLSVTPEMIDNLRKLRASRKFDLDEQRHYPGAPSEAIRARLEAPINQLLDGLIEDLPDNPTKEFVLERFKQALAGDLENEDSGDQDRALQYLEEIMDITEIASSDGLLNTWRYGFDPNDPTKPPQF